MLIILFGQPGTGKNFTGRVFEEAFGFHFYDADDDLPPAMRTAIAHKQIATDAMRAAHVDNIAARVAALSQRYPDIVAGGGFFKEWMRLRFLECYPDAQFVMIETDLVIRSERLRHRDHHLADLGYAEKIFSLFEPPRIPHFVLNNNADGDRSLQAQIATLLATIKTAAP